MCLKPGPRTRTGEPGTHVTQLTETDHLGRQVVVWNNLPNELRLETSVDIIKVKLKTFLFNQTYS